MVEWPHTHTHTRAGLCVVVRPWYTDILQCSVYMRGQGKTRRNEACWDFVDSSNTTFFWFWFLFFGVGAWGPTFVPAPRFSLFGSKHVSKPPTRTVAAALGARRPKIIVTVWPGDISVPSHDRCEPVTGPEGLFYSRGYI